MTMPAIEWAAIYQPAWADQPDAYVTAGLVAWGRSRRLGRVVDPTCRFKAYIGVQHFDPGQWGVVGTARAKFFLSLFVGGRTVALHTHFTMAAVLTEVTAFHAHLAALP